MRALSLMMFFTFYTASESLYRKTKWILSFYLCYLIINQYYYSLIFPKLGPVYNYGASELRQLRWYNLVSQDQTALECESANKTTTFVSLTAIIDRLM